MSDFSPLRAAPARLARFAARSGRRLHRDQRGQDVLEFAMIVPFVLFFIFVIIDFGLALGESEQINHAVREAARAGAVGAEEADIRDVAAAQSQSLLNGASPTCPLAPADDKCVEVTWSDGPDSNSTAGDAGDAVTVRARYRHHLINPFLAWLPFADIELGACAASRVEVGPNSPVDHGWDCTS